MLKTYCNFRSYAAFFFFALALIFAGGCTTKYPRGGDVRGEAIVNTARSQIGTPYRWGGCTPGQGFDCSGYIVWVYQQHGINLPRTAAEQAAAGYSVSRGELKAGDIVVFRPKSQKGKHTGIYTGRNTFLHSPKTGSVVREESISVPHWSKALVDVRRVLR